MPGDGDKGPGLRQDLIWRLEAAAFAGFIGLMRLIGLEAASNFGGWVLKTLGPITGTQKTVLRNLRIAFPEMGEDERRRLALEQWEQTGRTFAETAVMDRLTPSSGRIDVVGAERLEAIRASGKPVVFVSGHMANIETMAAVLVASGVPAQVTYRAANNPYVDAQIIAARARYGVKLFAPKGGDGARELLAGLGRGESVALMNDQKFSEGPEVIFFGQPVNAAPGPSRLAAVRHGLAADVGGAAARRAVPGDGARADRAGKHRRPGGRHRARRPGDHHLRRGTGARASGGLVLGPQAVAGQGVSPDG